jgi:hypothetical protein
MRQLIRRAWYFIRQRRLNADVDEEMNFNRSMMQREIETRGVNPAEAAFAARRAFGSAALAADRAHDVWTTLWLQGVGQDLRYAMRIVKRYPGFATAMVLTELSFCDGADARTTTAHRHRPRIADRFTPVTP